MKSFARQVWGDETCKTLRPTLLSQVFELTEILAPSLLTEKESWGKVEANTFLAKRQMASR